MKIRMVGMFAFIAISLVAAVVVLNVTAQKRGGDGQSKGNPHFGRPDGPPPVEMIVEKMAGHLSLTAGQKTQVTQILNAEKATMESLRPQLEENHRLLQEATKEGKFDEARVTELANQSGQLMAQTIVAKERSKAAIYNILTAEQRTKAAQMPHHFGPHHPQFGGERGPMGPPPPQGGRPEGKKQ